MGASTAWEPPALPDRDTVLGRVGRESGRTPAPRLGAGRVVLVGGSITSPLQRNTGVHRPGRKRTATGALPAVCPAPRQLPGERPVPVPCWKMWRC